MVSVVVGGAAAAFTCAATLGRTSATTNTAFACCSSSSSKGGGGFLGKCSLGKFPPSGRGQRTTTFGVSVSVSSYSIRRTRGRRKRVTIKNEIRTTDGNSKAARVLGLSLAEAKDERKLKRAYRRHALRTHPDTGGKSASAEAFQEVQKAYRTLRLEIASPDNEALTKEMSKDEEWEEHDWRWKVKYDKEKALDRNVNAKSQRKREEAFRRVEEMKRMAKMKEEFDPAAMASNTAKAGAGGEGNLFPSRANKKKKRVIKPISKQSSPMENFQKVREAEKERGEGG